MERASRIFTFPKSHAYPPMWDIQRVLATRETQFKRWSGLILAYCRHHRIWRLRLIEMLDSPLFSNKNLKKWLTLPEIREIVDWMITDEGQKRAEWVSDNSDKTVCWIYWRRPEEWAEFIASWVRSSTFQAMIVTDPRRLRTLDRKIQSSLYMSSHRAKQLRSKVVLKVSPSS